MNTVRRKLLIGAAAAGAGFAARADALEIQSDIMPRGYKGQPVPEPGPDKSAGGPGFPLSRE